MSALPAFFPILPSLTLLLDMNIKAVAWIGLVLSAVISVFGHWATKRYENPPAEHFVCFTSSRGWRRTFLEFFSKIITVVGLLLFGICLIILWV